MEPVGIDVEYTPDDYNWPYIGRDNVMGGGGAEQGAEIPVPPQMYSSGYPIGMLNKQVAIPFLGPLAVGTLIIAGVVAFILYRKRKTVVGTGKKVVEKAKDIVS